MLHHSSFGRRPAWAAALLTLTLLLAAISATPALATDWHIDTGGNDTTGNGSSGAPFATIARALQDAEPGDSVILAAGQSFLTDPVTIDVINITLRGASSAQPSVLRTTSDVTVILQAEGGVLRDIAFVGPQDGASVSVEGSLCYVQNCSFSGGGEFYAQALKILGQACSVSGCDFGGTYTLAVQVGDEQTQVADLDMRSCSFLDCGGVALELRRAIRPLLTSVEFIDTIVACKLTDCAFGDFDDITIDSAGGGAGFILESEAVGNVFRNSYLDLNIDTGSVFSFSTEGIPARNNTITANTIRGAAYAFHNPGAGGHNIMTANLVQDCTYTLRADVDCQDTHLFLNSSGASFDLYNNYDTTPCAVGAPAPVYLEYLGTGSPVASKLPVGNAYLPIPIPFADDDGNGILDDPVIAKFGLRDDYPLAADPLDGQSYRPHLWYLASTVMLKAEPDSTGVTVVMLPDDPRLFYVNSGELTGEGLHYPAGDPAAGTSWNGWLTFTEPLEPSQSLHLAIGYVDAYSGLDFQPVLETTITGANLDFVPFQLPATALAIPEGRVLAVQLTNTGDSAWNILTGGAHSAVSAAYAPASAAMLPAAVMELLLGE